VPDPAQRARATAPREFSHSPLIRRCKRPWISLWRS
jgi:hypothetical protein